MKILAFSGLHGNKDLVDIFLDSIIAKKIQPDMFICVGDIGDSIIVEIFSKIMRFDKPILFVFGNHTLHDNDPNEIEKADKLPNVIHLKGKVISINEHDFIGQDAWTNFTDNKKIDRLRFKDLSKKLNKVTLEKTILVTHHAPLGILDRGRSYPLRSLENNEGYLHGGSFAVRKIVERYKPTIHLFAHAHSDGGKWEFYNETLFVNVCHLERETRGGEIGINGSFMVIDTEKNLCIPHHLNTLIQKRCSCGAIHYLNYRKCFNCYKRGETVIAFQKLKESYDYQNL